MDDLVYVGYITGFHGIKGELKVKSDFLYKDRIFKKGVCIYINDKEHIITSYRVHKQFDLITIDDLYDINLINDLAGYKVYVKRNDLELNDNEYLYEDLLGMKIIDDDEELGIVSDIRKNNVALLQVTGKNDFLLPLVDEFIKKIDIDKRIIYTQNAKELIL